MPDSSHVYRIGCSFNDCRLTVLYALYHTWPQAGSNGLEFRGMGVKHAALTVRCDLYFRLMPARPLP